MDEDKLLFSGEKHADEYAKYRPQFPQELYSAILEFHGNNQENGNLELAVDIGCGSGRNTVALSDNFSRVVGIDISEAMISQAKNLHGKSHKNVVFGISPAEDLSAFEDSSVDLVTFATCFHWLDAEKVYTEVRRILKPGGVIAIYAEGLVYLPLEEASEVIRKLNRETLSEYWSPRKMLINRKYRDINLPFDVLRRDETSFKICHEMPLSSLIGYIRTWSGYQSFMAANPGCDILEDAEKSIRDIYQKNTGTDTHDVMTLATWPIFLVLGKK